jgi:ATP-dependent Clp protease ATP-binding subunit ClpA
MTMFERFTPTARSAVMRARDETRLLAHPMVDCAHVLLGVLQEADSTGARALRSLGVEADALREGVRRSDGFTFTVAEAEALRTVGIELDDVRRRIEETFGPGALGRTFDARRARGGGHIPFTSGAKKALELALREALQLGHRYIGTEHIVLGLIRDERSSALRLLQARGLDREEVRAAVLRELEDGDDQRGRTA